MNAAAATRAVLGVFAPRLRMSALLGGGGEKGGALGGSLRLGDMPGETAGTTSLVAFAAFIVAASTAVLSMPDGGVTLGMS